MRGIKGSNLRNELSGLEEILVRRKKGLDRSTAAGMKSSERVGEHQQDSGTDCKEKVGRSRVADRTSC